MAVVAEIKRRSPSRGILNAGLLPGERAASYVRGGAAALSVLTEPTEFGGDNADVLDVLASVAVPVLKKDFHVDESQVWEARALGASALLLIARALAPGRLERMVDEALRAGIEPLVEVRTLAELERALGTAAPAIGVNARDLETLHIDKTVTQRVLSAIPADRVAIAESGLVSRMDVEGAARDGADAVLIGSALSSSSDAEEAVRALAAVPRQGRGA